MSLSQNDTETAPNDLEGAEDLCVICNTAGAEPGLVLCHRCFREDMSSTPPRSAGASPVPEDVVEAVEEKGTATGEDEEAYFRRHAYYASGLLAPLDEQSGAASSELSEMHKAVDMYLLQAAGKGHWPGLTDEGRSLQSLPPSTEEQTNNRRAAIQRVRSGAQGD